MESIPSLGCPRCRCERDRRGLCPACLFEAALMAHEESTETSPGSPVGKFGRYELIAEVGRGGMGRVWRALDRELGREVAIKRLRGPESADAVRRERLRREALAVARLNHPGIVTVFEVSEVEGEPYLAMELVRGVDLAVRLKAGRLDPLRAAELVRDLAQAVDHAHQQGIIHRDLKPSNVLLDDSRGGTPRLTDFGIALFADGILDPGLALTQTLEGLGALSYVAPEQAAGARDLQGPATDVYGLGAILYHCLTGQPPFVGDSPFSVLRTVVEREVRPVRSLAPDVPRVLAEVCERCLEKRPDQRFDGAQALALALDQFLSGAPVPVGRGAWRRGFRRARQNPAIRMALVVGVLGIALAIGSLLKRVYTRRAERTQLRALLKHWPLAVPSTNASIALQAGGCSALSLSPDGRWLAAGDTSGHVILAALHRLERITLSKHAGILRALAWSSDSRWLISGDALGNWKLFEPARTTDPILAGSRPVMLDALQFYGDGSGFALLFNDGAAEFWDWDGQRAMLRKDNSLVSSVHQVEPLPGRRDLLVTYLTAGPERYGEVRDGGTWELRQRFAAPGVRLLAASKDGRRLATFGYEANGSRKVRRYQITEGVELGVPIEVGDDATSLAFSPDGGRLLVVLGRARCQLFDAETAAPLGAEWQLAGALVGLGFAEDGLRYLAIGTDGYGSVRDGHSSEPRSSMFPSTWLPWGATFDRDGRAIWTPDAAAQVLRWDLSPTLPPLARSAGEWVTRLRQESTIESLRLAVWMHPQDPLLLRELARSTRAAGYPWAVREAEFLESRAQFYEVSSPAMEPSSRFSR